MKMWTLFAQANETPSSFRLQIPDVLWLGLALPLSLLLVMIVHIARRRQTDWGSLHSSFIARLHRTHGRWKAMICMIFAALLLIFGLAKPTWGDGEPDGVAYGRDLIFVLDMSRSMNAEDTQGPSRGAAAIRTMQALVAQLRERGGHRIAVVIFAARSQVLVPLTTDYDHVELVLNELDPGYPPPEIRATEQSHSGTRIGLGLQTALDLCDARFPESIDVLLFSDGDDPVTEQDWPVAVEGARASHIPIHTIGYGDPQRSSTIVLKGALLEFINDQGIADPVQTQLNESVLQAIAQQSGGLYLPAHREISQVQPFLRDVFQRGVSREVEVDAVKTQRDRSPWFFVASALLLLAAMYLRR